MGWIGCRVQDSRWESLGDPIPPWSSACQSSSLGPQFGPRCFVMDFLDIIPIWAFQLDLGIFFLIRSCINRNVRQCMHFGIDLAAIDSWDMYRLPVLVINKHIPVLVFFPFPGSIFWRFPFLFEFRAFLRPLSISIPNTLHFSFLLLYGSFFLCSAP